MLSEKRYPDLRGGEERKRFKRGNDAESEASLDVVKHTNPSLYQMYKE